MMSQETIVNRTRGKKGWHRGKFSSPANSIVVGKKMRDEPKLFLLSLDLCSDLLHPELIVVLSEIEVCFGCDPVRIIARLSEGAQKAFIEESLIYRVVETVEPVRAAYRQQQRTENISKQNY